MIGRIRKPVRNSHDKTFPAGIVAGTQVPVCDNLSFAGEISLARKHTSNILAPKERLRSILLGISFIAGNFLAQQTKERKYTLDIKINLAFQLYSIPLTDHPERLK